MSGEDPIAALERRLALLEDRQAILDCISRSSRGNDRFDAELIAGTYHEDGLHQIGGQFIPGKHYGDHANEAHAAIADANLHNVTMHSCEIDGDVAHAESYVIGMFLDPGGATARTLAGRYIDRLERRDGVWRIALRRATVEVAMEGKAILPNGSMLPGSGYLRGSRDRDDPSYERPLTQEGGARW
jgi:hypothetical protein